MNALKLLYLGILGSAIFVAGCSPTVDPVSIPVSEQSADVIKTGDIAVPSAEAGNTRLYVTISCHRGTIPGTTVSTMPINAYVSIADEKYIADLSAKLISGQGDDPFISDYIGEDGIIDFDFDEQRSYTLAVASTDERLGLSPEIVSNHAWNRVQIEKGKTVHHKFIMAQAWCDKDRGIRGIDPDSYNIQVMGFSPDYDSTTRAGFGVDKQFYARTNSGGSFKYNVDYGASRNGSKRGPYLDNGAKTMVINNVQTEKRIKRVCGSDENSLDVTIRADGALGVKTYSGDIGGDIVNCREAYATEYPFTYAQSYSDAKTPGVELYVRHVDSHNNKYRTNCPAETLAKINTAPITYPGGCLESIIVHTNIFEAGGAGVFPWGRLHKYSHRFDLTKLEEVKGKVPPTILP